MIEVLSIEDVPMINLEKYKNALNGLKNADIRIDDEIRFPSISAIEKQIPMKPEFYGKRYGGDAIGGKCPVCGRGVNSKDYNYCHWCGQKMDWSEADAKG